MSLDERKALALQNGIGAWFAVPLPKFRFVVEQVLLRRRAGHVQIDHPARFGREVGPLEIQTTGLGVIAQNRSKAQPAHAVHGVTQELATCGRVGYLRMQQ